jgi:hypothetical protein
MRDVKLARVIDTLCHCKRVCELDLRKRDTKFEQRTQMPASTGLRSRPEP